MAKKAEKVVENAAVSSSTPVAEDAPQSPVTPSPMPETQKPTALAAVPPTAALTQPNSAAQDALVQAKALAARLPDRYKSDVLMNPRPTPEQLVNIVMALPDEEQSKMMEIVRKANPKKQGAHTARTSFSPTNIVLFHGTGKDEMRPKNTVPGQFYTKDARILGENFVGAVIGFYEGRIMWPQRGPGGAQEGGSAPICVSFDRITGSKYGECNQCPNADKPYNQGGCMREVTVFLMDRDMSSVYSLTFSKSSQGAGEALVKILQKSENIWDRWINFESQERTKEQNRWFVIKATPLQDTKNPANNNTPKSLHPLFSALSRVLDHDVYFQGLADTYDRSKNSPDAMSGSASAGDTFNEKAMLGTSATDDNPDYGASIKDV